MNIVLRALPVLLVLCAGAAQAQLYKWVGPDGKVSYSDTPPPHPAAKVETRPAASAAPGADLPYEVAHAMRNHPVTLYTSSGCTPCNDGRALLTERGVPFREKTVSSNEDLAEMRKLGGDGQLPLLTIGRTQERGFDAGAWNRSLSAAGYPATSRLPRNYRNPPAEPAAPRAEPQQATRQAPAPAPAPASASPTPTDVPPAGGNAPPGFRF